MWPQQRCWDPDTGDSPELPSLPLPASRSSSLSPPSPAPSLAPTGVSESRASSRGLGLLIVWPFQENQASARGGSGGGRAGGTLLWQISQACSESKGGKQTPLSAGGGAMASFLGTSWLHFLGPQTGRLKTTHVFEMGMWRICSFWKRRGRVGLRCLSWFLALPVILGVPGLIGAALQSASLVTRPYCLWVFPFLIKTPVIGRRAHPSPV